MVTKSEAKANAKAVVTPAAAAPQAPAVAKSNNDNSVLTLWVNEKFDSKLIISVDKAQKGDSTFLNMKMSMLKKVDQQGHKGAPYTSKIKDVEYHGLSILLDANTISDLIQALTQAKAALPTNPNKPVATVTPEAVPVEKA